MLIALLLGYFTNLSIKDVSITNFIDKYLGVMAIPLFILLFIYGFIFLTENKLKRKVREIKWYFILILLFLLIFLFVLFNSGITYNNYASVSLDENFYRNFLNNSLYKYKLGYFFTYLFYLVLGIKIKFKILLISLLGITVLFLFLIIFGPIRRYIGKIKLRKKEQREAEQRERLLQEQIKIKEDLDRKVMLKKMKFKENKEKLRQEKIDALKLEQFRNSIKLEKTVTLNNKENNLINNMASDEE